MTKSFNINSAAFVAILTLTASVNVNAQTPCPTGPGNIEISVSCNTTGLSLTGNQNLTIGPPASGITITATDPNASTISVSGAANTINNTGSNVILRGNSTIFNTGTQTVVTNSGLIESDYHAIYNSGGTISALTNSGTISTTSDSGVFNLFGTITTLTNTGTIRGANDGGVNNLIATITTLTNTGTISSVGTFGIRNQFGGTIGTLNNLQGVGNAAGALTYEFTLPTFYNIIIRSPNEYGQLVVTDPSVLISPAVSTTTFGIFTGSTVRNGTYAAVLRGIDSTNLANTPVNGVIRGDYETGTWELRETTTPGEWDLFLAGFFSGPTTADTQQSLVNSAAALQNTYALQNAVLANSFSYDCSVFGSNNVCVSAGGRNTAVSASNGLNNTSALLIAAYRIKPTLRIGAYADQNLSVSNAGSTVNLGNNTPLIGLFGVWNERLDGTGTEVKVSAAYGQKNTTVNRQVVGTSEAGSGSSNLNSQGAQITARYGFAVAPEVLVSPYVGLRYTQNNMGGYTEGTSATVTAPLTYSALNTNATTALAGVTAAYRFIPKATAFASAGVETDTNTSGGTYSASGVTGLTPVNFNPNPVRTRPTATLGAYYDIVKNQRIGITGIYRQESYQAISTTTVMATYTIGL